MEEEEQIASTEYCSNCKKDIPSVNYVMHSSHCSRNITLCEICNEGVPISEKEEHFEEYHMKVKCDCGESVEKMDLDTHKETDCKQRKVICEYCELELPFIEMKSHQDFCGSRTELCDKCNKYIQHKDLEDHLNSDCQAEMISAQNNAASSTAQHRQRNRIPPDELIQNVDLRDGFGFDAEALQRLLIAGMSPERYRDIMHMDRYGTLYGTQNRLPQPNPDVVARGLSSSNPPPNRQRRNRHSSDLDEQVYNEDRLARNQLEDDELMAALLTCDENDEGVDTATVNSERGSIYRHNLFDEDPEDANKNYESALDQTVLPCEFCGEAIQAQDLIQHQTGCQLTAMGAASLSPSEYPNLRSQPRSLPPIQYEPLNNEFERDNRIDYHDETLLPCEFCEELIPTDLLFSHQSMCDPQRTRPSSVLQTEHFYGSEPEPPYSNNSRPRATNRPHRPSRPVVDRGLEERTSENQLNKGPISVGTSLSTRNDNGFPVPRNNIIESRRQLPSQRNDNLRSNGPSLTTNNIHSTKNSSRKQGQNNRHTHPEPASEEYDGKYEIALPTKDNAMFRTKLPESSGSASLAVFSGMQETKKYSKISAEKNSFRNGDKAGFQNDSELLRPLQETVPTIQSSKYPSSNEGATGSRSVSDKKKPKTTTKKKISSSANKSDTRESFRITQESRNPAKAQPGTESRRQNGQQRTNRNVGELSDRQGSAGRTERTQSTQQRSNRSKKKFA